jgi:hypothetical protein
MRPGRPSAHVKARWVTWRDDSKAEREFYEMDRAGKLVGGMSHFEVHHTRPCGLSVAIAPTVSEAVYSGSKTADPEVDQPAVDFQSLPELELPWDVFDFFT